MGENNCYYSPDRISRTYKELKNNTKKEIQVKLVNDLHRYFSKVNAKN
jgi:hypothetical protein